MYAIIDIESNGDGYRKERIIDVAVYRFNGHEITDQFSSLVNPEAGITPYVQKLTGITPKMVKTAPKFHELAKRIVEITEGATLVGHNIEFDYRMLRQSFKQLGYDFKINTLDTIPLAKKLIPEAESYSLGKLVKSLGIPLIDQHRAAGDARATLELFKLLLIKDKDSEIIQTQHEETNSKTYINKIRELTQDLPNERGIVYFQDGKGKILFSDFVDDINKFSKKLFNSKSKRWEAVQQHCEQISYEFAGSNIVAKLLMKVKGIKKSYKYPFGLFFRNGKYRVEKTALQKNEDPILLFRSYTQGLKAVSFIKSKEEFADAEYLKNRLELKNRTELWLGPGRVLGEKMFIILERGRPTFFGYYELFSQIQSLSKLNKLKIAIPAPVKDLQNDLKLELLRGNFEVRKLPVN